MNFLEDVLRQGHVAVYDFKGQHLPDLISSKESGSVRVFLKEGKKQAVQSESCQVQQYDRLSEIRDKYKEYTDIHLLDGEAIKLLLAKYPYNAPYAMARVAARASWLVGMPGLIRRIASKQIKIRGIATLKTAKAKQRWLVLEHVKYKSAGVSLSSEIGVQGFLDYLRKEGINYVVMRFYEKLPELFPNHEDMDLLMGDDDATKVKRFLLDHPGDIHVDVWNLSSHYYPPHLADKMLNNAVDGPGGSRVPGPKEAFLSFAYHALYRKGFRSGIPSQQLGGEVTPDSDDGYAPILAQMADSTDVQVSIEMESLDEYLNQEGWRPTREDLARRGASNEWVRRSFLSHHQHTGVGLGVLILKEKAVRLGLVDKIIEEKERQQFTVLRSSVFDQESKEIAATTLRGGNWTSASGDTPFDSTPAVALAVLDTKPSSVVQAKMGRGISRVRPLKIELRKIFDDDDSSLVHSADDVEAWEYVEICFPQDVEAIREKISQILLASRESLVERFRFPVKRVLARQNLQRLLIRFVID